MKLPDFQIDPETALYPPQLEWAEEVYQLIDNNRAYLERWLDWLPATQSVGDAYRFLFDAIRFNEGGQRCTYLISYHGQIAGFVSLMAIDYKHHTAEMGYWLSEHLQGRGIVSRSCEQLLEFAFAEICLNRIALRVMSSNSSSKAVALRLGFTREGCLREAFRYKRSFYDLELFSILRKDWKKS